MPWHIAPDHDGCPTSKPWAVVVTATGRVAGCHVTKAKAQAQLAALNANVPEGESMSKQPAPAADDGGVPPRQDLFRVAEPGEALFRDADDGPPVLFGHFNVFDRWAEIDSAFEGHFLERFRPGAFARTIERHAGAMKVLYQHGRDPTIGDTPIGKLVELREDDTGPYYEAEILDPPAGKILPGLRAGVYGASFRFKVLAEEFDRDPERGDHNPDAIPERTITEAEVSEFGPVTFPAYADATAGLRSDTDRWRSWRQQLSNDPERLGLIAAEMLAATEIEGAASSRPGPTPQPVTRDALAVPRRKVTVEHFLARKAMRTELEER